jgi:hypothetical protein
VDLGFVRAFGRCGLGGQEQDCHDGPGRGDGAGDDASDGQAAQECVGGGVLQCLSEDRMAEGRDLAGGHAGCADGLVRDRRDPAGQAAGMVAASRDP